MSGWHIAALIYGAYAVVLIGAIAWRYEIYHRVVGGPRFAHFHDSLSEKSARPERPGAKLMGIDAAENHRAGTLGEP